MTRPFRHFLHVKTPHHPHTVARHFPRACRTLPVSQALQTPTSTISPVGSLGPAARRRPSRSPRTGRPPTSATRAPPPPSTPPPTPRSSRSRSGKTPRPSRSCRNNPAAGAGARHHTGPVTERTESAAPRNASRPRARSARAPLQGHRATTTCTRALMCSVRSPTALLELLAAAPSCYGVHLPRSLSCLEGLDKLGQHLTDIADDAQVGDREYRGLWILVDGDDVPGRLHPDDMLNGT